MALASFSRLAFSGRLGHGPPEAQVYGPIGPTVILGSRELYYLCMSKQSEAPKIGDVENRHLHGELSPRHPAHFRPRVRHNLDREWYHPSSPSQYERDGAHLLKRNHAVISTPCGERHSPSSAKGHTFVLR